MCVHMRSFSHGTGHDTKSDSILLKKQPVLLVLIRSYTIVDYYCWLVWCARKILFGCKFTIVYDQAKRPIVVRLLVM